MKLLWLPVTILVFLAAMHLRTRRPHPLLNPTLVSVIVLGVVLLVGGEHYRTYAGGTKLLSDLLTPAVVALAVPLYRHRDVLRAHGHVLLLAAVAGAGLGLAVGWFGGELLSLPPAWRLAALSRTVTSPIAIALAGQLHGRASLSAVLTILTGLFGAVVGPVWLSRLGIEQPVARGLAHGIASHGLGTARMVEESGLAGAAAAVGMALGGLMLAVAVPLIWS